MASSFEVFIYYMISVCDKWNAWRNFAPFWRRFMDRWSELEVRKSKCISSKVIHMHLWHDWFIVLGVGWKRIEIVIDWVESEPIWPQLALFGLESLLRDQIGLDLIWPNFSAGNTSHQHNSQPNMHDMIDTSYQVSCPLTPWIGTTQFGCHPLVEYIQYYSFSFFYLMIVKIMIFTIIHEEDNIRDIETLNFYLSLFFSHFSVTYLSW